MNGVKNFRIDADRLWDSIMEMARIGPGVAGGNNRQALTDDDAKGRELFSKWCKEADMSIGVDAIGNMFATRPGSDPDALPVFVGSHLDTQPTGGKYDGVLGVLGGLELVRTLNDLDVKTKHPITIVNWTNEEGTRFAPPMLASGVFAGKHELEWAYQRVDADGKKFGDEFHVFSIIWDENAIKWFVNDIQFNEVAITQGHMTEFHAPFFFIFNIAVGGNWPGYPDATTVFPQQMVVDYVRVFQRL